MVFAVFQWYELMALAEMNASGDWQFSYVAWDKKQAVKDDPKFPEKWGCHLLKWQAKTEPVGVGANKELAWECFLSIQRRCSVGNKGYV